MRTISSIISNTLVVGITNICFFCTAAKEGSLISSETTGTAERLKNIQDLATRKLEKIPEARLSFSVGEKTIVVRDVVLKAIDTIKTYKDIISVGISLEPSAGLAWGGIMAILPVSCHFQVLSIPPKLPLITQTFRYSSSRTPSSRKAIP